MKTWGRVILIGVGLGVGACSLLLPERFAVNAPVFHMLFGSGGSEPDAADFGGRIRAADGFSIGIFASGISNARWLRPTAAGHVLVSRPRAGEILRLDPDRDGDGRSDARQTLLEGLDRPHGIDLYDGWLYVGEADGIGRVRFDESSGQISGPYQRVVNGLPSGGNHWTRTVRFGPDGWMYVTVGSSCNVCEDAPRRAAMLRFRPDGSGEEIYATGLRNSVGFDWRPATGELYATDNGRDLLGDDLPPCELNRIVRDGFYGWPYVNGNGVADPDFGTARPDLTRVALPPAHAFGAHNAPLGITFVRSASAPPAYRGAALVALHGSWNRSEKDGYKVVSLHWDADGRISERDFVVGFETDDDVVGRPVDVAEGPDGTFYVSDDYAGAVYRISATSGASSGVDATDLQSEAQTPDAAALDPAGEALAAARGEQLYARFQCAGCHESQHAADGVVIAELNALPARYSVDALTAFLAAPTPPMPVFAMDDGERRDLAVFLLGRR